MSKLKQKRVIDARIWKTGNSYVITIPLTIIEKLKLNVGDKVEIILSK